MKVTPRLPVWLELHQSPLFGGTYHVVRKCHETTVRRTLNRHWRNRHGIPEERRAGWVVEYIRRDVVGLKVIAGYDYNPKTKRRGKLRYRRIFTVVEVPNLSLE